MTINGMSREPEPSKPTVSPNWTGQNFRAKFSGGALFGILLLALIAWIGFLSLMAWEAISSLFG
jgi:hypothetical protein